MRFRKESAVGPSDTSVAGEMDRLPPESRNTPFALFVDMTAAAANAPGCFSAISGESGVVVAVVVRETAAGGLVPFEVAANCRLISSS